MVVVFSLFWLMELSMGQTRGVVNHVEVLSFAMIAVVGFYITCMHTLEASEKHQ